MLLAGACNAHNIVAVCLPCLVMSCADVFVCCPVLPPHLYLCLCDLANLLSIGLA